MDLPMAAEVQEPLEGGSTAVKTLIISAGKVSSTCCQPPSWYHHQLPFILCAKQRQCEHNPSMTLTKTFLNSTNKHPQGAGITAHELAVARSKKVTRRLQDLQPVSLRTTSFDFAVDICEPRNKVNGQMRFLCLL